MRVIAVVQARMSSSRFPGKMLADKTGKPLIQHVYEAVRRATTLDRVVVATDDAQLSEQRLPRQIKRHHQKRAHPERNEQQRRTVVRSVQVRDPLSPRERQTPRGEPAGEA